MSPDEKLGRRVIGAFVFGLVVALFDAILDIVSDRLGSPTAHTVLNDLIIGATAGIFAYAWMSRETAKIAQELSLQKHLEENAQNERKRIALELHDTVCQTQTGVIMQLECAVDALGESPEARGYVNRALQLVRDSLTEMRCALWDLYPEELQKVQLKGAMERLVKELTANNGLASHFSVDGMIRPLPPEIEKGLLRISQEALSNVVKHAQAREVQIKLSFDSQRARLYVKDDGQGFRHELVPGGFGLTSMENRTKALGGVCTIHSEPGHGTEVHASIPIPPAVN